MREDAGNGRFVSVRAWGGGGARATGLAFEAGRNGSRKKERERERDRERDSEVGESERHPVSD